MSDWHDGGSRKPALVWLGVGASASLSAVLLLAVWMIYRLDAEALIESVKGVDVGPLIVICIASALFHVFVGAHKLRTILRAMNVSVGMKEALALRMGADPFRLIMPLRFGELAQVFYVHSNKRVSLARASGMAVLDRGLNLFGALFWLAFGIAILPVATDPLRLGVGLGTIGASWMRVGILAGAVAAVVAVALWTPAHQVIARFAGRLHPKLDAFFAGMLSPLSELSSLRKLFFLAYGVLFQLRPLLVCWALLTAHGLSVGVDRLVARASVAVLAGQLPGTMAGAGPREAIVVGLFRDGATGGEVLLSVGLWMTFAVNIFPRLLGLPWTLWFLRSLRRR